MPGRFAIGATYEQAAREFHARPEYQYRPSYNIFPGRRIPAILDRAGERVLEGFTWGMPPSWGGESGSRPIVNARSETIEAKKAFREAFLSRRCLIPISGYYEWKQEGKEKSPYYITVKSSPLFALAAIWSPSMEGRRQRAQISQEPPSVKDGAGRPTTNAITITTEPNDLVREIHHRMPAILPERLHEQWLDPNLAEPDRLKKMLVPYPPEDMSAVEVSRLVSNPKNQGPELIRPVKHHLKDFLKPSASL